MASTLSSIPLPSMFIHTAGENRYTLIQVSILPHTSPSIYSFSIIEYPKYLLSGAHYTTDGIESRPQLYIHQRVSSRTGEIKTYETHMIRLRESLCVSGMGIIPFYKMSHAHVSLPSSYTKVSKGLDTEERWHFKMDSMGTVLSMATSRQVSFVSSLLDGLGINPLSPTQGRVSVPSVSAPAPSLSVPSVPAPSLSVPSVPAPSLSVPSVSVPCIPTHVFNVFVESAVQRGDTCSVTFEPLTKETAAAPPCGHLVSRSVLDTLIENGSPRCPQCRESFCSNQILTYKF